MTQRIQLRHRIISIIFIIITLILTSRILYLSSLNPDSYNILQENKVPINRGDIVDRNYRILAVSDKLTSIYANPKEIKDKNLATAFLSESFDIDKNEVLKKLSKDSNFTWIKRKTIINDFDNLKKQLPKGIYFTKEFKRFYPNINLASHILGFCNIDNEGVEGIEKTVDKYLSSKQGLYSNIEDSGYNVQLTIDSTLQSLAESSLLKAAIRENADSASLILASGKTGEILALANYPDFDPNSYGSFSQKDFRNKAIFNQYEPGSVFKIFTIAALLDNYNISPSDYFFCDGSFEKDNLRVKCTGNHGHIGIEGIFKFSCNDATLQAAEKIKNYELYHYIKSFGFGEETMINLPGEQKGKVRKTKNWSKMSMLALPIGQEISVNSLQMVQAATTFLNDGIMVKPFILKKIFDNNNHIVKTFNRKEIRRVISKGLSEYIINFMKSSTEEGGTASGLDTTNLQISAKSGTAQVYDIKQGKYSDENFTSSLITIFPSDAPEYIAYTVFHNPKGEIKWGGVIGADLLNDFLKSSSGYLNLPKTDIVITSEIINQLNNYKKINKIPFTMPDLTGISGGDFTDVFSKASSYLDIKIYGKGSVYKQSPTPGTTVTKNDKITIFLRENND